MTLKTLLFRVLILFSFCFFIFLSACEDKADKSPVSAEPRCHGDSLCAELSFSERTLNGAVVVDFTITLSNRSGRTLVVDSTYNGTYIEINPDTARIFRVWVSPPAWGTDTVPRQVTLAPGGTRTYADTWGRTDALGNFVAPGRYLVHGALLDHKTHELAYTEF